MDCINGGEGTTWSKSKMPEVKGSGADLGHGGSCEFAGRDQIL